MKTVLLPIAMVLAVAACTSADRARAESRGRLSFRDDFNRVALGPNWRDPGKGYTIEDGALVVKGARNRPLWLRKKLPPAARVEFTARSKGPEVDIKAELFGDGHSRPQSLSYTATSYVVVLGGWRNTLSVIARMNEHGDDRETRREPRGQSGKLYKMAVARAGRLVLWTLDGAPFLELEDEQPLLGAEHEYFAFNGWESTVRFDDLAIYEL